MNLAAMPHDLLCHMGRAAGSHHAPGSQQRMPHDCQIDSQRSLKRTSISPHVRARNISAVCESQVPARRPTGLRRQVVD